LNHGFKEEAAMKSSKLNRLTSIALALGLALSTSLGGLSVASAKSSTAQAAPPVTSTREPVNSISLMAGTWGWKAIDERSLILWTLPSKPYLVKLGFPSQDLKWVNWISLRSMGDRLYARFDSVYVRGIPYPIDSIYPLTEEEARNYGHEPSPQPVPESVS
jgi:Family of unknown function (DUF6491)